MSNNATKRGARGLASVDWDDVHPDAAFYLKWLRYVPQAVFQPDYIYRSLLNRWLKWEKAGADAYYAATQPFEFRPGQKCVFLDAVTNNRRAVIHAASTIKPGIYADFCQKFGVINFYTRGIADQVTILDQVIVWIDLMRQGAQPSELLAGWEAKKKLLGDDWNKPDYARSSPGPGIMTGGIVSYETN